MARRWLKLRVSDVMIATAVAAFVLHSAIDPLNHTNGKPLLVLTLDFYPLLIFPCYCLFRLRRGGTITRTDCLAAVVMFLSVGGRIHSHMSNSEVWMLRLSLMAMGLLIFDVICRLSRRRRSPELD
jgi:hypothetical protein